MKKPGPIRPDRVRTIKNSFSWIDHGFINTGIIDVLTKEEMLLYYFLINVGDKEGISFYRRETICSKLKIGIDQYEKAKEALIGYDLIAYKPFNRYSLNGYFQVLSLPRKGDET
jgi:hypothetical protein